MKNLITMVTRTVMLTEFSTVSVQRLLTYLYTGNLDLPDQTSALTELHKLIVKYQLMDSLPGNIKHRIIQSTMQSGNKAQTGRPLPSGVISTPLPQSEGKISVGAQIQKPDTHDEVNSGANNQTQPSQLRGEENTEKGLVREKVILDASLLSIQPPIVVKYPAKGKQIQKPSGTAASLNNNLQLTSTQQIQKPREPTTNLDHNLPLTQQTQANPSPSFVPGGIRIPNGVVYVKQVSNISPIEPTEEPKTSRWRSILPVTSKAIISHSGHADNGNVIKVAYNRNEIKQGIESNEVRNAESPRSLKGNFNVGGTQMVPPMSQTTKIGNTAHLKENLNVGGTQMVLNQPNEGEQIPQANHNDTEGNPHLKENYVAGTHKFMNKPTDGRQITQANHNEVKFPAQKKQANISQHGSLVIAGNHVKGRCVIKRLQDGTIVITTSSNDNTYGKETWDIKPEMRATEETEDMKFEEIENDDLRECDLELNNALFTGEQSQPDSLQELVSHSAIASDCPLPSDFPEVASKVIDINGQFCTSDNDDETEWLDVQPDTISLEKDETKANEYFPNKDRKADSNQPKNVYIYMDEHENEMIPTVQRNENIDLNNTDIFPHEHEGHVEEGMKTLHNENIDNTPKIEGVDICPGPEVSTTEKTVIEEINFDGNCRESDTQEEIPVDSIQIPLPSGVVQIPSGQIKEEQFGTGSMSFYQDIIFREHDYAKPGDDVLNNYFKEETYVSGNEVCMKIEAPLTTESGIIKDESDNVGNTEDIERRDSVVGLECFKFSKTKNIKEMPVRRQKKKSTSKKRIIKKRNKTWGVQRSKNLHKERENVENNEDIDSKVSSVGLECFKFSKIENIPLSIRRREKNSKAKERTIEIRDKTSNKMHYFCRICLHHSKSRGSLYGHLQRRHDIQECSICEGGLYSSSSHWRSTCL